MALLDDIGTILINAGQVGGVTGWTLYKSYLPDEPDKAIAIFETGGDPPDQSEGTRYDVIRFQLIVRGVEYGYDTAHDKIQTIFNALNDVSYSGYVYIFGLQANPLSLGYDVKNRPELSINFECMKQRS